MQLLLDACAGVLETLQFHSNGPYGCCEITVLKGVQAITNDFTVKPFNLSWNTSLQALKVPVPDINYPVQYSPSAVASTLKHVLLKITSPTFSEITIVYQEGNFLFSYYLPFRPPSLSLSRESFISQHLTVFPLLNKMKEVHNFKLVLCVNFWVKVMEYAVQELEWEALLAESVEWEACFKGY